MSYIATLGSWERSEGIIKFLKYYKIDFENFDCLNEQFG